MALLPSGRGRRGGRGGRLVPPPVPLVAALVVDSGSGVFAMLVLLVPVHLVMCSLWLMSGPCCSLPIYSGRCLLPFFRQSGGHSSYATETGTVVYRCSSWTRLFSCPVLCNDWPSWSSQCRKSRWFRSCSSSMVVDILVFAQLLLPMVLPVQKTIEIPQLQLVRWSMPFLCRSCHARCRSDRCSWFRHCRENCGGAAVAGRRFHISVVVQRQIPMSCSGP